MIVRIPGVAHHMIRDGGFQVDSPQEWRQYTTGRLVRRGRGYQWVVSLNEGAAIEIADYLQSVIGALESMSAEERGEEGMGELRAARVAVDRLRSS